MALHNRPDSTSQPPARPLPLLHPQRRAWRATAAGPGAAEGSLVSAASTASASGGASTDSPGACGGRDPQEPMQMVEETEVVGTTPREGLPLRPPPPPPAAVTSSRPEHGESTRYGPPQCPPPPSVFACCECRWCVAIGFAACKRCRRRICKSHAGCGVCELCVECTHCQCGGLAADEEDSPTADDKEGPRYRPSQKARASHHAWLQRGGPLGPDPSYPARTPPATIGAAEEVSSGDFGLRRGAAEVGCTTCTTRTSDQSMH